MIRSYFNSKADIWDEQIAEKDLKKLADLAEKLDIQPGSTVLDVGTGTGVLVPFLLRKIGGQGKLVCLDCAEEMLRKAQAKNFTGNIRYICADIMDNHLESGLFDAVVCYSSFPHFQDKPFALRETYRLLKTRGNLFIGHTSSRAQINQIHRQIPILCRDLIPEDEEMRQWLAAAGFGEIKIEDGDKHYLVRATKSR